jgi:AcrR family transcriptional regulator
LIAGYDPRMSEPRRGAPRSEAARRAILEATTRLFAARGYDHLTIEGIAAEAKVGKQTIYRWWPSRGALVAECLLEGMLMPEGFLPPDTGDVRADLTTWLEVLLAFADTAGNRALLTSLVAAAAENEDVGRHLDEVLGASSALTARLQRAVDEGQLDASSSLDEIADALVGAVVLHILRRTPAPTGRAGRLVGVVLGPSTE